MDQLDGSARQTSWTDQLDRPAGQTSWTDQLDGSGGRIIWMDQLDGPAGQTSWTDQLDGSVFYTWSLGHFAYSKIDLSVCTLSQLPSLKKALFHIRNPYLLPDSESRSQLWKIIWAYSGISEPWKNILFLIIVPNVVEDVKTILNRGCEALLKVYKG